MKRILPFIILVLALSLCLTLTSCQILDSIMGNKGDDTTDTDNSDNGNTDSGNEDNGNEDNGNTDTDNGSGENNGNTDTDNGNGDGGEDNGNDDNDDTVDLSGITLENATFTYDGAEKSIKVSGNLPEGITVEYTDNVKINAGIYTVTARLIDNDGKVLKVLNATLTVNKATYDMSAVSFKNASFSYTGAEVTPKIEGTLPEGVSVSFTSSPAVIKEIGEYKVTAIFNGDADNYNAIPNMTATYTIAKIGHDALGVSLPDKSFYYNGEVIEPELIGTLPDGISATLSSTPAVIKEIGAYTVTAKFYVDGVYGAIVDMTATYVVKLPEYTQGSLSFELLSDGTYEVVGYNGTITDLAIPSKYQGKAVTSIKSSAFADNEDITYVFIPSSVTNIGNKAFKNCEKLDTLLISGGVKVIGAEAFANTAVTKITLPDSLESLGKSSFAGTPMQSMTLPFVGGSRVTSNPYVGYLFGALSYSGNAAKVPSTLTSITVSGSAGKIPAYAFYGVESLASVTVMSGVKSIGNSAFSGCISLDEVYIADTVTEIEANAYAFNSPFFGASESLMIVLEVAHTEGFGRYWRSISDITEAFVVYGKSYEDYLMNKDDYRNLDSTVATLNGIFVDGRPLDSFASDILNYTISVDINKGYPIVSAMATSAISEMVITNPTAKNSGIATIVVTSADGMTVITYTVTVELTGTFTGLESEVVGKDGTTGTVTFVIDDGNQDTAIFTTEMMDKYGNLKFTYAILTNQLATLQTEYDPSTGKYYYVTSDGKYTYTTKEDVVAFWVNILTSYDTEVISHTYSHAFWGNNDDGGVQKYVDSNGNVQTSGNLPVGSASAEIYASIQIIEELLGIRAAAHVVPGISVSTTDTTVNGVTYETYYTYYQELLKEAIDSGAILALAGNTMGVSASSINRYVTKDTIKALGVNGVARLFVRPTDDTSLWTKFIDNAADNDGWATFCIHKISESPTSGHYILEKDAEALFAHAASKNVWVANYTEAFLYYTEWASAKVSSVYEDGSIRVTLTDDEDNAAYNEALTVKVSVPASWASAEANGEALEVYTAENGTNYVLVNIVPDSGTVTLNASN